jgi:sphingomyelin phosphodiesterase acid-like 3
VNPYSTIAKFKDVCGKDGPEMFLTSEKMADLLVEYADVMRLGIFAHTHMDEMRLLQPEGARPGGSLERRVALKLVPSISPVDGNDPSFTVARINPATALMQDYAVIAAPDRTGGGAWTREYDYAQAYHQAEYSPAALIPLISTLEDDRRGRSEASEQYMNDYFVGKKIPELKPFWPQYACSLANYTARGYSGCVCSQGK